MQSGLYECDLSCWLFWQKNKTVNNKEAKLNTVNTWNQNNTTCFTPSNYFDCVVYWFKDFYPTVAGVRQVFCNVFFNICNSLNPEQFAHFQQFLKAVTLCFSVMLGSLWYGVPAACEWVSVMKIYRKQTFGLFCLGSQPYTIWSSADPVSYSGTYIWALFAMFFSFYYVLCCFLCNLRISTWSPSWD